MAKTKMDDLKKFYRNYRRYYINHMRRKYGDNTIIPNESFKEFIENIKDAVNDMTPGTHSGMKKIKILITAKIDYGDGLLFSDKKPQKSIEIPIEIVDGSCGRKTYSY